MGMESNGKYDIYFVLESTKLFMYINFTLSSNWSSSGGIQGWRNIGNPILTYNIDKLDIFAK